MAFRSPKTSTFILAAAVLAFAALISISVFRNEAPQPDRNELITGTYVVYRSYSNTPRGAMLKLYRAFLNDSSRPPELVYSIDEQTHASLYNQEVILLAREGETKTLSLSGIELDIPAYQNGILSSDGKFVAFPDTDKDVVLIEEVDKGVRTEILPTERSEFSSPFPAIWSADNQILYGKTFIEGNSAPTGFWKYDRARRSFTDLTDKIADLIDVTIYPELEAAVGIATQESFGELLPEDIVKVDLKTGTKTVLVGGTVTGRPAVFSRFALSSDGKTVAYSYTGGEVWLVPVGREPRPEDLLSDGWLVGFSDDGTFLVTSGTGDDNLRIVNTVTRESFLIGAGVHDVVGIFEVR